MSSTAQNAAQSFTNPYAAQQAMLVERLEFFLAALPPILREDVELALEQNGKLLASRRQEISDPAQPGFPAGTWSILTLSITQYVSQDLDPLYASSAAVAIECYICALDLLDDVEDEDQTSIMHAIGPARVLNVSTALLALAHTAILSLSQLGMPAERMLCLLHVLQEATLTAVAGQHRDLLAERRLAQDFTFEECIEIAEAKAGALMSLALQLGAICAGADENKRKLLAEAGTLLGIAHQLDNDSHDLYDLLQAFTSHRESALDLESTKSDLIRNKKTLPVVIAAGKGDLLKLGASSVNRENSELLKALQEGVVTTWGVCLLYRERARERLHELEAWRHMPELLGKLLGL